jgi:hypothetical protein
MRQRAASWLAACAAVVLVCALGACSGPPRSKFETVTVAPGVSVRVLSGSPSVKATAAPAATRRLTARIRLAGGRTAPSALAVLAPARHLVSSGPLAADGVILTFHVAPDAVSPGTTPFLASLDPATGKWVPVPSSYSAAAGTVSARVTHFSVWTVLDWVRSKIADVLKGALSDIFGPVEAGAGNPVCTTATGGVVTVSDSRPGGGIGACAQSAGQADVLAKIADLRSYPVDLLYPAGTRVQVPATDVFTQLGEDLNNLSSAWHDRVLLPGKAEAGATVTLAAGHSSALATEMDPEAYLTAILGTALNVLASMSGKLAVTTGRILDLLAKGTCLRDLVATAQKTTLSAPSAEDLGAVGFECISAAAKLGAAGVVASLAAIISSLASELMSGIWGIVDTARGNADHVITLSRTAAATQQVQVSAVDSQGNLATGLQVTQTVGHANCEPGSEAIGAAYRCFAGNFVYDPCWADAQAATPAVLCLEAPWSHDVTELKPAGGLAPLSGDGGGSVPPWGLQLSGGQQCILEQGAHDSFDGRVVDYYCGPHLVVLRGLDMTSAQWRAQTALYGSSHYTIGPAEGIAIAWFGIPART